MADEWDQFQDAPGGKSYDTQLAPADEKAYRVWMNKIGHTKAAGYRVDDSFTGQDYDYRGFFQKNGPIMVGQGQHLTDEFKKPVHETFSNESRYAVGEDAAKAGKWNGETFQPPQGDDPWAQFQDAPQASPPEQPAQSPVDTRPTGDALDAVIEPAMAIGSGAVATPAAGIAGLWTLAGNKLNLTDANPVDVIERVQGALTYQPRTKAGAAATNVASYPFEKVAQGANWLGEKASDATGSPVVGAAVNTATQMLAPAAIFKGVKGVKARVDGNRSAAGGDRPVASSEAEPSAQAAPEAQRPAGVARVSEEPVPTKAELADAAKAAYKRADEAGVVVKQSSLTGLKTRLAAMTKKEGLDRDLHPDATAAFNKILKTKGEPTLSELETLRKVANDAKGSIKPADKRMASKIVDELDDYIDNLKDVDLVAGDATKAGALKEARNYYSRMKKAETLDELVSRAELSAPNFSASGMENALRTEFRNLAKNQKKMRMFTAQEQAAIRKVAQGGKAENALRFIGKFAPTGPVSGALGGGLAVGMLGPTGVAVPIAGLAGRYAATRMTNRNVQRANELVRRGPEQANTLKKAKEEKRRNALADF